MNAKTLVKTVTTTVILSALSALGAQSAKAVSFGTSWDTNCVGGTGAGSCSLQNLVNSVTTAGPTIDTTQDSGAQTFTSAGGTTTGSYLFSVAGYAANNKFGLYKLGDPHTKIQLFGGKTPGITAGAKTMVNFLADGSVKVGNKVVKNFGSQYGFYLDRQQGRDPLTVYSQNLLNEGGAQQMVAYTGNGQTHLNIGGTDTLFDKNSVLLGIEDLRLRRSDRDYNDLVVLVSGVRNSKGVPEPMALLGLAAVGAAGVLRRRPKVA